MFSQQQLPKGKVVLIKDNIAPNRIFFLEPLDLGGSQGHCLSQTLMFMQFLHQTVSEGSGSLI